LIESPILAAFFGWLARSRILCCICEVIDTQVMETIAGVLAGPAAAQVFPPKCLAPLAKLDYDCFKNIPKERQAMAPGWEVTVSIRSDDPRRRRAGFVLSSE
jgi:hypothetical protein